MLLGDASLGPCSGSISGETGGGWVNRDVLVRMIEAGGKAVHRDHQQHLVKYNGETDSADSHNHLSSAHSVETSCAGFESTCQRS